MSSLSHGTFMPAMSQRRVFISTVLAAVACMGLLGSTAAVRAGEKLRVGVSIPAAIAFVPLQVGIDGAVGKRPHEVIIAGGKIELKAHGRSIARS